MNIHVSQIYPEAGVNYPFTHRFQQFLSRALTESVAPSANFVALYGDGFDLIFRMSAKSGIDRPECRGPTVFRRDKDVEYTIFLPFRGDDSTALREAIDTLLKAIIRVLAELGFDTTAIASASATDPRESSATRAQMEAWQFPRLGGLWNSPAFPRISSWTNQVMVDSKMTE